MGGFKAIFDIFPPIWNWQAFWTLTAFLSIMLGVLNLLPIPALDGGHVMFLIYEMVTGKKLSDKFMETAINNASYNSHPVELDAEDFKWIFEVTLERGRNAISWND